MSLTIGHFCDSFWKSDREKIEQILTNVYADKKKLSMSLTADQFNQFRRFNRSLVFDDNFYSKTWAKMLPEMTNTQIINEINIIPTANKGNGFWKFLLWDVFKFSKNKTQNLTKADLKKIIENVCTPRRVESIQSRLEKDKTGRVPIVKISSTA